MSFQIKGSVALITGAAGGIGASLATELASKGCDLALMDKNEPALIAHTKQLEQRYAVKVTSYVFDITDSSKITPFAEQVIADHGRINILINNAGVAVGGRFIDVKADDFDWVMSLNFRAHVNMTREFLGYLTSQPEAQIVNISSLFGVIASAGQTAYCSSKFALRGFSEALNIELMKGVSNTRVTTVHPGGVKTDIATSAKLCVESISDEEVAEHRKNFEKNLRTSAEDAAKTIVKGIEKRKRRVIVGTDAKILSFMQRVFPAFYQSILRKF